MEGIVYPHRLPASRMASARLVPALADTFAAIRPGSTFVELGAHPGDITEALLKQPAIAKMLALDHFSADGSGAPPRRGDKPLAPFLRRFAGAAKAGRLEIRRGRVDAVKALPGASVHGFLVRGCHQYSALKEELYMCDAKLHKGGMIWVADYIMSDYVGGQRYEVVRAVNEFAINSAYELAYFVLAHTMFCTVVLRRSA